MTSLTQEMALQKHLEQMVLVSKMESVWSWLGFPAVLQVEAYMVFEYTLPLYAQLNRSFKLQLTIIFPFVSQKQDLKKALEFSDFD